MRNKIKITENEPLEINIDPEKLPKIKSKDLQALRDAQKQGAVQINISNDDSDTNLDLFEYDDVIEPKDPETIKYLSNVIDNNTGKISQPFTIVDKNYQMVRGLRPNGEIVMAVMCLDDSNIYEVDTFEKEIALPMKEKLEMGKKPVEEYDYAAAEREYYDREDLMDYLNLRDLEGYKHFFVNINTGEIVGKFKNYREMMRSGIKLGSEEDYMGIKQLKAFRAGEYFKEGFEKTNEETIGEDINIDKLKGDVKILIDKMTKMFGKYFAKLDTPMEQSVFLAKIGQLVNVPVEKLPQIVSSYKELAKLDPNEAPLTGDNAQPTTENVVMTKNQMLESLGIKKKVIKTIKVKDIK